MVWLILGFVVAVVLATSLIKHIDWSPKQKNLVAVVLSTIGAALSVIIAKGGLDALLTADLLESVVLVYGGSQALYNFVLHGTALENKLAQVGSNQVEG